MNDNEDRPIRLALPSDYPDTRLIELPTHVGTSDDFNDAFDIAERALGENVPQGSLFAYLFRRFGYPNRGWDDGKELACYMLTTKHPDMLLRISPYVGGDVSISFSFQVPHKVLMECRDWISRDRNAYEQAFLDWIETQQRIPEWADELAEHMVEKEWPIPDGAVGWRRMMTGVAMLSYRGPKDGEEADEAQIARWYDSVRSDYARDHPLPPLQWRAGDVASWEEGDPMKPLALAMIETLRDLERPVWIRDYAINLRGGMDEDDDDLFERSGPEADVAHSAGFGSGALGNHDPRGVCDLHYAVLRLDSDPAVAIAKAAAIITETAAGEMQEDGVAKPEE